MNNIPKSNLAKLIIDNLDAASIRNHFSIKPDTDIYTRLCTFSLPELNAFISSQDTTFVQLVERYSDEFPLKSAPTLYILNKVKDADIKSIEEKSFYLSSIKRLEPMVFSDTRTVRAVYTSRPIRFIETAKTYELDLCYEKRVEIIECDPESDQYNKKRNEFSLENALLWFSRHESSFAILACCDFSSVFPLISYLNKTYSLEASLPNLSEAMLENLAKGGKVRNATFSLEFSLEDNDIDANTISIYDPNLSDSKIYSQIKAQPERIQRSGYYINHPHLLRAGLGISCKYGRLWTPAHLDRNELIALALGSIAEIDILLKQAAKSNPQEHIDYFTNREVLINKQTLSGEARKIFNTLIYYLVISNADKSNQVMIDSEFQKQLFNNYKKLKLIPSIINFCPNCGEVEISCPNCGKPISLVMHDNTHKLICSACKSIINGSEIICDCGEPLPALDMYTNIEYIPSPELLTAISTYAEGLHPEISLPAIFKIKGNIVLSLSKRHNSEARVVNLGELKFWKVRAHIDMIKDISPSAKFYILHAGEKCKIKSSHPTKEDCSKCLKKHVSFLDIKNTSVCLLRLFGIPIDILFDGIHHGREFADIIYTDEFDNKQHTIGIHVKKHQSSRQAKGLGRTNYAVKGLYTQVFYTLFELHKYQQKVDTVGIAIPNNVSKDVIESLQTIVIMLGHSFIAIQQDDWERIAQAAITSIEFEE